MKQLGWTSNEQSKKLVEAGLDPNTADMNYRYCICKCIDGEPKEDWLLGTCGIFEECPDEQIPCWSLGRLIDLMPEIAMLIYDSTGKIPSYFISIGPSEFGEDIFLSEQYSTPIEAVVSTIIWLLENNYIKKGETK